MTTTGTEPAVGIVDHAEFEARLADLFTHVGVPGAQAAGIAEILVLADLRGIESHGANFAPRYLRGIVRGELNPAPKLEVVGGRGAAAVLDADNGLGFVAARTAMELAVELAGDHAVGAVTVRNSNHFGMAGFYALQAVEAGMIGHATTDGPPHTVAWGTRRPVVCNNPIAWAFPTATPPPVLVDTALTGVKEKIRLAAARGETIPPDWAVGPDGRPTTDPAVALEGSLLPIGGPKGSALIVANELLSGALAGALFSCEISPALVMGADHHDRWSCGHFLLALDPAAFGAPEDFRRRADELVARLRGAERAEGVERVWLPGEREWELAEERRSSGLPVARATLAALDAVAGELSAKAGFEELTTARS
ncbi:MAG TPA: Ldh family oxidoreductase [Acidimicrobiia bacterium]|jgi:LDH2 family malate/lactate/ureidoglycolate dehydrogenase